MTVFQAIIYGRKHNFGSTYLGRCGDNWITENVEIGFPPAGETGRQEAPYSYKLFRHTRHGITRLRKLREPGRKAQVPTAVTIKSTNFRDVTPCSSVDVHRRLKGMYGLHLQVRTVS
jgi:hypothetical protein